MLTPRDRRTIVAMVKETMLKHFRAAGWEPSAPPTLGWVKVRKRFASNAELAQQLDMFSEYRFEAWVE
jgi:plasmid replication initiation protein